MTPPTSASAHPRSAIEKGEIDAIANVDPLIAKLEASGKVVVMADTRTMQGSDKVFGGTMSAAVVYLKRDFLVANPNTVQALVNAFYRTLQWMQKASPEQIADNVPQEYWLGDKALYLAALKADLQVYSLDGGRQCGQPRALAEFSATTRQRDRRRAHRPAQDLGGAVCRGRGEAQLTCGRSGPPSRSWARVVDGWARAGAAMAKTPCRAADLPFGLAPASPPSRSAPRSAANL
jgi:hypothetical protein